MNTESRRGTAALAALIVLMLALALALAVSSPSEPARAYSKQTSVVLRSPLTPTAAPVPAVVAVTPTATPGATIVAVGYDHDGGEPDVNTGPAIVTPGGTVTLALVAEAPAGVVGHWEVGIGPLYWPPLMVTNCIPHSGGICSEGGLLVSGDAENGLPGTTTLATLTFHWTGTTPYCFALPPDVRALDDIDAHPLSRSITVGTICPEGAATPVPAPTPSMPPTPIPTPGPTPLAGEIRVGIDHDGPPLSIDSGPLMAPRASIARLGLLAEVGEWPLGAWEVNVSFDPAFLSYNAGKFFCYPENDGRCSTGVPGRLTIAGATHTGLTGNVSFATFGLYVRGSPGECTDLLVDVQVLADAAGRQYEHSEYSGTVCATDGPAPITQHATPTPPPVTIGMDAMSIDLNVSGNTSTALGTRERCLQVQPGETFTFDVTADQIPSTHPMIAFGFGLNYPVSVAWVLSGDANYLLGATAGSAILNPSEPMPDGDGQWSASAADFSESSVIPSEFGTGVLMRVELAVNPSVPAGLYLLALTGGAHVDPQGDAFPPAAYNEAYIAVNMTCDDAPTPRPAPTPSATAPPVPTPTATVTPVPQPATATPTPTPTPVRSPQPTPIRPANCPERPKTSFTIADPPNDARRIGDPSEHVSEIESVTAAGDNHTLCVTVTFADTIDPNITGYETFVGIGFDLDEESATGEPFRMPSIVAGYVRGGFCGFESPGGIGAEAAASTSEGAFPATFEPDSITIEIPMLDLRNDRSFNFYVIAGMYPLDKWSYPDDCAANGGSIHWPDGRVVPAQDRDSDNIIDWDDICLGEPDGEPKRGYHVIYDVAAIAEVDLRPFNLPGKHDRVGKLTGKTTIENLTDWTCWIDINVRISDLPQGCQALPTSDYWIFRKRMRFGPHERVTVKWSAEIECADTTPPGDHPFTVHTQAGWTTWDYLYVLDEASTAATLRIR